MDDPTAPTKAGDDVELRTIDPRDGAALREARDAIDAAEADVGVPLIDEAERVRLDAVVGTGAVAADPGWVALRGVRGATTVGYGAAHVTGAVLVAGDAAPVRVAGAWTRVLPALASGVHAAVVRARGGDAAPGRLQLWVRHVASDDLATVLRQGFELDRRLGVLGRRLDGPVVVPDAPDGTVVRAYRPDRDDAGVVEVLAAAYEGTGDGGWDLARFQQRRALPWFRPEDLLVAVDERGTIGGLHWLKRRDATTGEVYNLAVHPDAQGRGLGPVLLGAGLAHLRDTGHDDVVLWVDLANQRAVRLYAAQGFEVRWEDVALGRDLPGS